MGWVFFLRTTLFQHVNIIEDFLMALVYNIPPPPHLVLKKKHLK